MRFPADQLEKRLTEFQLVESADGTLVGALGIQILRQQAWLHSESFHDFAVADTVRPLLLERLRSLASNHGVLRLWTRETSPFWIRQGFQPAPAETLKKLPETWADSGTGWLTLQLKNEEAILSVEKELALFMESEKQRTQRAFQHAHALKVVATLMAVVLALFILAVLFFLIRKNPALLSPHR